MTPKLYRFKGHYFSYQYLYSIADYKMYRMYPNTEDHEYSDRYIVTKDDVQIMANDSQVTLEALLIDELMTIDIKDESIEFVDVALGIIDALAKKDENYA